VVGGEWWSCFDCGLCCSEELGIISFFLPAEEGGNKLEKVRGPGLVEGLAHYNADFLVTNEKY
jgi:hypothetical protein